jgi:putative endonuclease
MGSWVRAPAGSQNKEGSEMFFPFLLPSMYTLYILYSISLDRYYVGYTNDLERRLHEHNRIKGKYTDTGIPWKIVYTETFESKKTAMSREAYIKSRKSKSYIIELINSR